MQGVLGSWAREWFSLVVLGGSEEWIGVAKSRPAHCCPWQVLPQQTRKQTSLFRDGRVYFKGVSEPDNTALEGKIGEQL